MSDHDGIVSTIDTYLATFSASDRDAWLDCFAEDAWIESPVGTPRRQGLDAIDEFWEEAHAIPDRIELRLGGILVVVGNEAAFTVEARPNLGGEYYVIDVIDTMTFDHDARIRSNRAFYDPEAVRPAED